MRVLFVRIVNILLIIRIIKLMKRVVRQEHYFSTRIPFARKTFEKFFSMVNGRYETLEDMIKKYKV